MGRMQVPMLDVLQDPVIRADPHPYYRSLREEGPIVEADNGDHLITRYAECFEVLRDVRFSNNDRHKPGFDGLVSQMHQIGYDDMIGLLTSLMLYADPPDHTRLRRLVSKAFTHRAVEAMRPRIRRLVHEILDDAQRRGEIEVVEDLALRLPVTVISGMLGVPLEQQDDLRRWTAATVAALDPHSNPVASLAAADALREMREYFDGVVDRRRGDLGDDLLSAMIAAEDEGERLTHDELLDTTLLLYAAGHDTTVNLISGGMLDLLRNPDQLARLQSDPSLCGGAVEEVLRYSPPAQFMERTATVDVEIAGKELPQGSLVIVMLAAANRDPEVFPDPDAFDIGRTDNRHLAFSNGIHLCLGAPLARVEGQEAIGALVQRFPNLRLAEQRLRWKPTTTIRGLEALHLLV